MVSVMHEPKRAGEEVLPKCEIPPLLRGAGFLVCVRTAYCTAAVTPRVWIWLPAEPVTLTA